MYNNAIPIQISFQTPQFPVDNNLVKLQGGNLDLDWCPDAYDQHSDDSDFRPAKKAGSTGRKAIKPAKKAMSAQLVRT